MTAQPPVQPPRQPSELPVAGSPLTQPMPAAGTSPTAARPAAPTTNPNVWRQATSTRGGRWAVGVAAAALAILMILGIGVAGFAALRFHDRFNLLANRTDSSIRGLGNGPGPGAGGNQRRLRGMPGMPGSPGGPARGPGGLGMGLGGSALHGSVTATINGSVQALVFQRGEVTAVSATSISLKSSDGFLGTYGRTAATVSRRAAPVKGGQAFVLARASDKVAITTSSMPAGTAAQPSN